MLAVEQARIPSIGNKSQSCKEANRDQYRDDGYNFVVEWHIDSTEKLILGRKWRRCRMSEWTPFVVRLRDFVNFFYTLNQKLDDNIELSLNN